MLKGVIAEFNPFHNGHKYLSEHIKKDGDILILVLSSNLVQRGEIPVLDKFDRAKIAMQYGYDIVVELPSYYSFQSAEIFAKMAIKILNELGVQKIYCGTNDEIEKIAIMDEIIRSYETKEEYKKGFSTNEIYYNLLKEHKLEHLYTANNILYMEYTRAIKELKYDIEIQNVIRKEYQSASYIRKNLDSSNLEIPKETKYFLDNNLIFIDFDKYYALLKYKILFSEYKKYFDVNKTIFNTLKNFLIKSDNYVEYMKIRHTKNFSDKRLNRAELNILLDITDLDFKVHYIRILGMKKSASKYLKLLNNSKIIANWKKIDRQKNSKYVKYEKQFFVIYEMLTNNYEKLSPIMEE